MANMRSDKNPMPHQAADVRNKNFSEVALGYTADAAIDRHAEKTPEFVAYSHGAAAHRFNIPLCEHDQIVPVYCQTEVSFIVTHVDAQMLEHFFVHQFRFHFIQHVRRRNH